MSFIFRVIDAFDTSLCKSGLFKSATWGEALDGAAPKIYAGRISRRLPQYRTHFGLTPFHPSTRNIPQDLLQPLAAPDGTVTLFQAEDVLEHLPYEHIPGVLDEIHRVLRPGGRFRMSVPDYRCDVYATRALRDPAGDICFDPGGGGRYADGKVLDGGHLWFPTFELVRDAFARSAFADHGTVEFLHYTAPDGASILNPIDYSIGHVARTPDHDPRAASPRRALSIVVDAVKSEV